MLVLGVESSCDETAAALLEETPEGGTRLLSSVVSTQIPLHRMYGGVIPELASRNHSANIPGVLVTFANLINVYDVLNAKKLVVDKAALAKIEEVFA